jgi:heme-binding protein/cytochrome P460
MRQLFQKKIIRLTLVSVIPLIIASQFVRPRTENLAGVADFLVPDSVKAILRTSCYDCHSIETRLSWFDKITPVNWLVASDIQKARQVLNFSGWDYLSKDRQKAILFESLNQMQFHEMPLWSYSLMHSAAVPTPQELSTMESYVATLLRKPMPDSAKTRAERDQYVKWIHGNTAPFDVKNAPNGIAYIAGVSGWGMISFSEHLDDDRTRIVLGNQTAINAIRNNQTNPWPDGSVLAKLAWFQTVDSGGLVRQGAFKQVALMIKDKKKFKSTLGWGFAQWQEGLELKPHGMTASFTSECVNCHKPMRNNDYVFTTPVNTAKKHGASLICTFMDNAAGTMSALYGNDPAARYARSPVGGNYPAGSELTLVSWVQQMDPHWFGVLVPGELKQVEKVIIGSSDAANSNCSYTSYSGNSAENEVDASTREQRIKFILRQRAAVTP